MDNLSAWTTTPGTAIASAAMGQCLQRGEMEFGRPTRRSGDIVRVRLIRKLADVIDGIDLQKRQVGDVLYLSGRDARLLVAEGWAEQLPDDLPCGDATGPARSFA